MNSDLEMTLTLIYLSLKSFVYEMNVGSEEVKMLIVIEDSIMKMMMKQSKVLIVKVQVMMKWIKKFKRIFNLFMGIDIEILMKMVIKNKEIFPLNIKNINLEIIQDM